MFTKADRDQFDKHDLGTSPRLAYAVIRDRHEQYPDDGSTFAWVALNMGVSLDRAKKACNQLRNAGLINIIYHHHEPAELVLMHGK